MGKGKDSKKPTKKAKILPTPNLYLKSHSKSHSKSHAPHSDLKLVISKKKDIESYSIPTKSTALKKSILAQYQYIEDSDEEENVF